MTEEKDAYKAAGVDIEAGDRLVRAIAPLAKATARPGADAALGGFGGVFDLKAAGFADPLLVAGNDGVGTKLRVALEAGRHDQVGIDLVAMCVNDILAQGAEPLFFLDYYACGRLDEAVAKDVIQGIAKGCELAGCALIGGETAEMPGMYADDDYDLAGFCVGAVERGDLLPRRDINAGDVLIGLASSGAHSNGFSLIRKIVSEGEFRYSDPAPYAPGESLAASLLSPTRIYVKNVLPETRAGRVKAIAHITGGGLTENIPRSLPDTLEPRLDLNAWPRPPLFDWLQSAGGLSDAEMLRTFNCGIGLVVIAAPEAADALVAAFDEAGEDAKVIGEIGSKT